MTAGEGTALLVMDVQRGIVRNFPSVTYLPRLAGTIAAARAARVPVVYVGVKFRPGHPEISARNKTWSAVAAGNAMLDGTEPTEFAPEVAPQDGDVVVTKRRVGAFSGSDLQEVLRGSGITRLVLAGISTSGVVLSTVRLAADLDYQVTVLSDGCLDNDEEVHRVLVQKLFPRQATVLTAMEWIDSLGAN
jgi:nicotinamidase-related amidase